MHTLPPITTPSPGWDPVEVTLLRAGFWGGSELDELVRLLLESMVIDLHFDTHVALGQGSSMISRFFIVGVGVGVGVGV